MAEAFPLKAADIVAMLAALFDAQGDRAFAEVLRSATPSTEETGYDNWNGGTTYHTLNLTLPVATYANIEGELATLEEKVAAKLRTALRGTGNNVLGAVVITPAFESVGPAHGPPLTGADIDRIWTKGMFRLFLSHVSEHKVAVANLKLHLAVYGVDAFVAHEDIEPTLEWQAEIERALESMDAMAALLTPEFHGSRWTDQEVGIAVGRAVFVMPVRLPENPYGFIGKNQGLPGDLANPADLASRIVTTLVRRERTKEAMRDALVFALESSTSFASSKAITKKLEVAGSFTPEQVRRIHAAIRTNAQVNGSFGVPERLNSLVGPLPAEPQASDELDDLPF